MAINFPVKPGTVLICDYSMGFRVPEMVKRRPVVVISPRLPYRDGLCTVVPLSTTPPDRVTQYQCRIEPDQPLPAPFDAPVFWAKADMLATVCFERLDLFRLPRAGQPKRRYIKPSLSPEDLAKIRACVLCALGISSIN